MPRAGVSTISLRDLEDRYIEVITVLHRWLPPLTNEVRSLGLGSEDSTQLSWGPEIEPSQYTNPLHC